MTLIKSISGIRGTIGGMPGDNLTPVDIVKFASAYSIFIKETTGVHNPKIVVGRDARMSGSMVFNVLTGTLIGMGCDVIDAGMATTPTTEVAVVKEAAQGGIVITASHNPKQWNALKLLNSKGEFLNAADGQRILEISESDDFDYALVDDLGKITQKQFLQEHIQDIINMELVDVEAIKAANIKVAVDAVNSIGGIAVPELLYALGIKQVFKLHCATHGNFSHDPEPLPKNLTELSDMMKTSKANVGFAVDPDVDRLVIYAEDGEPFGEEYTLVTVADYILQHYPGNTVSNLSSTRALRDVTQKHGGKYFAAAVGEINVVEKMKEVDAVIGGEGNGGVIYPEAHYGRDAMVGIALFLTHLAQSGKKVSEIKKEYPLYFMSKQKVELTPETDTDAILEKVKDIYKDEEITDIDGVKIDFPDKWVHLRKSNTEPIIRIYSEAKSQAEADKISEDIIELVNRIK